MQFYAKAIFFMDWLGPAGEGFKSMGKPSSLLVRLPHRFRPIAPLGSESQYMIFLTFLLMTHGWMKSMGSLLHPQGLSAVLKSVNSVSRKNVLNLYVSIFLLLKALWEAARFIKTRFECKIRQFWGLYISCCLLVVYMWLNSLAGNMADPIGQFVSVISPKERERIGMKALSFRRDGNGVSARRHCHSAEKAISHRQ